MAGGNLITTLPVKEQGHRAVHQRYADKNVAPPDGLLFTNDVVTLGALAAMRGLNIFPNQDVRIATHSNRGIHLLTPYEGVLTRLEVD